MKPAICQIPISKKVKRHIDRLVEMGILSVDREGTVNGLIEHLWKMKHLETHEVAISKKFLNKLAKTHAIFFDDKHRVWKMEECITGLIDGKTLVEIGKERDEEIKKRRH